MSRCKACNGKMQDYEMLSKNSRTGEHEEMCRKCINLAFPVSSAAEISFTPTPLLDLLPNGPQSFDD